MASDQITAGGWRTGRRGWGVDGGHYSRIAEPV